MDITQLLKPDMLPVWVLVVIVLSWTISKYGNAVIRFFQNIFNTNSSFLVNSLQKEVTELKTLINELEDENKTLREELEQLRLEHSHFKGVIEGFTELLKEKGINLPSILQK